MSEENKDKDVIKFPQIEVKCGTYAGTNDEIFSIYIKSISEAVSAARNDKSALEKWNQLGKELTWFTKDLLDEMWKKEHEIDAPFRKDPEM